MELEFEPGCTTWYPKSSLDCTVFCKVSASGPGLLLHMPCDIVPICPKRKRPSRSSAKYPASRDRSICFHREIVQLQKIEHHAASAHDIDVNLVERLHGLFLVGWMHGVEDENMQPAEHFQRPHGLTDGLEGMAVKTIGVGGSLLKQVLV